MSAIYNLEPQPTASCILNTTSGDVSLELWAKQTPLTCRNFLQHCLDGYYDGTIFHRLVPGFILQGGDPTGSGNGGESIYDGGAFSEPREEGGIWPMEDRKGVNAGVRGVGFKDEFHSRLKFNRRGLLAMANEGENTNGSQFFITLGNTPELQGKNTLFGRVEGDTIYNVAKMGEIEVGAEERPVYPVRITGVEILVNPFTDMVKRERFAAPEISKTQEKKKSKRKAGKQLLSFGEEDGDAEDGTPALKKTKFDTRIVMDSETAEPSSKPPVPKEMKRTMPKPISVKISPESTPAPKSLPKRVTKVETRDALSSPEPEVIKNVTSALDRTNAQIAELKASMRRNVQVAPEKEKKKSALDEMIPEKVMRGRKRNAASNSSAKADQRSLDILNAFRAKLAQAPPEKETSKSTPLEDDQEKRNEVEDDEEANLCDLHFIAGCQSCKKWDAEDERDDDDDDDGIGWMSHALSFKEDKLGKDLTYRKKAEEEMVVIDPREKARTLKEEKRAQREARAGGSGGHGSSTKREAG